MRTYRLSQDMPQGPNGRATYPSTRTERVTVALGAHSGMHGELAAGLDHNCHTTTMLVPV